MHASLCYFRKPSEDPPDEETGVSDRALAEALFDLVEQFADGWLDVGPRIQRARTWRINVLRGDGSTVAKGRLEDDLWQTATILSQVLQEECGLKADDISTAFDLIGVPGEDLGRAPYYYGKSRDRVEAALRRALDDAFDNEEPQDESLDFDPDDSLDSMDSSDGLAVAA